MRRWILLSVWLGMVAAGCSKSETPKNDVPKIPPSTRSSGESPMPGPPAK
jgi:hypothetical protein